MGIIVKDCVIKNDKSSADLVIVSSKPTYLKIVQQIYLGNKTVTGIAKALELRHPTIYEQLKRLERTKILKRDNKNWEVQEEYLKRALLFPSAVHKTQAQGMNVNSKEELIEVIKLLILTSTTSENFFGIFERLNFFYSVIPKEKFLKEIIRKLI